MKFRCCETLFPIEGKLATSQLINYMKCDFPEANEDSSQIYVPSEYYACFLNISSSKLQDMANRLELYNFLEVDETYIKELCREIGIALSVGKDTI